MVRYVRQKDYTSCGPIALINILKWIGVNVTYNNFIEMARGLCGHEPGHEGGTRDHGMMIAFRKLRISYSRRKNPTLAQIDFHLDSGDIILLDYTMGMNKRRVSSLEKHFVLIIERTPKMYTVVNGETKNTVGRQRRSTLEKMLSWDKDDHYAWFIHSKNKSSYTPNDNNICF